MPASGVEITDDVTAAYNRLRQPPKDLHWVKFGIDDKGKFIEVKGILEKGQDFDIQKIDELFTGTDCFYLVIEVKLPEDADGVVIEKLVFIQWVPENAKIKQKMLYASSAESLKGKLEGLGAKIEAHESGDVTFEAVKAAIKSARGK